MTSIIHCVHVSMQLVQGYSNSVAYIIHHVTEFATESMQENTHRSKRNLSSHASRLSFLAQPKPRARYYQLLMRRKVHIYYALISFSRMSTLIELYQHTQSYSNSCPDHCVKKVDNLKTVFCIR